MKKKYQAEKKSLEAAFELSDVVRELFIAGLKRENPKVTKKQIRNIWARGILLPY